MAQHDSRSVREVEREVEITRSQVSATLDELRNKMAPGAVVDSMIGYASENGGADFLRTLGNQVRTNPLPVTLIGAGVAWLAMSSNRSTHPKGHTMVDNKTTSNSPYPSGRNPSAPATQYNPRMSDGGSGSMAASSNTGSGMVSSVKSTMSSVGDSVASAYDSVTDAAQNIGERISGGASAASDVAQRGYRSVQHGYARTSGLTNILKEQPLVTLALGVAIGAAIGAALPATETENEYLGPMSDATRERVQELASEQYENVQQTASDALEAVKSEARAQGLTSDKPTEMLKGIGDKIGAVAGAAKTAVSEGVDRSSKSMTSAMDEPLASGSGKV
jgi:hypothetical protein